ncbi:MAG TPA: class I SAM-dependent methyltransferase, partial [Polyangiaceae bacterium]
MANPYGPLCTEFYALDKPTAPPDAFDFYLAYAQQANGPILEPMCGTGRFLLPLLEQGFDVEGLDHSKDMLAVCRALAADRGLAPVLHQRGIEALPRERQFALVFIPLGSFSLLTDGAVVKNSLRMVHDVLLPGGTFAVEVERMQKLPTTTTSGTWGGRWLERPDGAKLVISWLGQYSASEGISRSLHRYELIQHGKLLATEFEDFELRVYEPAAFEALLAEAGFTDIQRFRPYAPEPPDDSDEAIIFVARK